MQTKEEKSAYKKTWYAAHPNYKRAYYKANKEKIAARGKAYRTANPGKIRNQRKAYYTANPKRFRAKHAVFRAIAAGRLVRPRFCSLCRKEGPTEGHHKDYSKPLEVKWLCRKCHRLVHRLS